MLTQTKVEMKKRSQRGSVLLMVVLSIMLLFTLTTICLDVINRSTKASSKNVQKTQAKITAESVLTEFIDGYALGREKEGISAEKYYQGLMDMAGSTTSPTIIKVEMTDGLGAVNKERFGESELRIYKVGASTLKVESVCKFSSQEQTASVIFQTVTSTPFIPSNTVEGQRSTLTTSYGEKQVSAGVDGDIYVEDKDKKGGTLTLSRADYNSHIYSEYSIIPDDQTNITDTTNKTNKAYAKDDRVYKTKGDPDVGVDFVQAPAVTTEGYFAVKNNFFMYTSVGKTDALGNVPTDEAGNPNPSYKPSVNGYGNYDGFLLVENKLLACKPDAMNFNKDSAGNSYTNDIDVYTHGAFFGYIPRDTVDGKNFKNEWNSIFGSDDGSTFGPYASENLQFNNTDFNLKGNFYSYKDTSAKGTEYNDGAFVVTSDTWGTPTTNSINVKIDGDLYVDGNMYLKPSCGKLNVTGKIYCTGKIYIAEMMSSGKYKAITEKKMVKHFWGDGPNDYWEAEEDVVIGYAAECSDVSSKVQGYFTINDSGTLVWHAGTVADGDAYKSQIVATGGLSNSIDYSIKRNVFPSRGYDPASGHENITRTQLSKLYADASANDIFKESLEHNDPTKYTEAEHKNIAAKYADAMANPLNESEFYNEAVPGDRNSPNVNLKYKFSISFNGESVTCYEIRKSTMLNENQAKYGYFTVRLDDDDIVIAMPIATASNPDVVNSAKFRIQRVKPNSKGMLYFMYYDPKNMDKCLYYDGTLNITKSDGSTLTGKNSSGEDVVVKNGSMKYDETNSEAGKRLGTIKFGRANGVKDGPAVFVADYAAMLNGDWETDMSSSFSGKEFGTNKSSLSNYITYFVPDEVQFDMENSAGACKTQGMIYGLNSDFRMKISTDGNELLGQIKGKTISFIGNSSGKQVVTDCSMAGNSILQYVRKKNFEAVGSVKIQYFQY